jgi:hypothetical protein
MVHPAKISGLEAMVGSPNNEEVYKNIPVSAKFILSGDKVLAWIAPRTDPPFAGFVSTVAISVENPDALRATEALKLLSENGGRSVFADFIVSYKVVNYSWARSGGARRYDVEILSVAKDCLPNWWLFPDYEKEGLHQDVLSTVRFQKSGSGVRIDFRSLAVHGHGWPRGGGIDVANPEKIPLPPLDEEGFTLADYLLTYRIPPVPASGASPSHRIAEIIKAEPKFTDPRRVMDDGFHENIPVTLRADRIEGGEVAVVFLPSSNVRPPTWPQSGSIAFKNQNAIKIPDFKGEVAYFDSILSYNLSKENRDGPLWYSAEVVKSEPLRQVGHFFFDPREPTDSSH